MQVAVQGTIHVRVPLHLGRLGVDEEGKDVAVRLVHNERVLRQVLLVRRALVQLAQEDVDGCRVRVRLAAQHLFRQHRTHRATPVAVEALRGCQEADVRAVRLRTRVGEVHDVVRRQRLGAGRALPRGQELAHGVRVLEVQPGVEQQVVHHHQRGLQRRHVDAEVQHKRLDLQEGGAVRRQVADAADGVEDVEPRRNEGRDVLDVHVPEQRQLLAEGAQRLLVVLLHRPVVQPVQPVSLVQRCEDRRRVRVLVVAAVGRAATQDGAHPEVAFRLDPDVLVGVAAHGGEGRVGVELRVEAAERPADAGVHQLLVEADFARVVEEQVFVLLLLLRRHRVVEHQQLQQHCARHCCGSQLVSRERAAQGVEGGRAGGRTPSMKYRYCSF
eukprot:Rhum_TRINITY_DN18958_c0_g1::Rhum_TRINITY_DN18958_c0_g1_i1::g.168890::m.168890